MCRYFAQVHPHLFLAQARREGADTPCKWMWEDSVYQWRADGKRAPIFDLFEQLIEKGLVMDHSEADAEWARYMSVTKLAVTWVTRHRRTKSGMQLGLLLEYMRYYEGAPYHQDGSDPEGVLRDEDHRSKMQNLRKARYKATPSLKLHYCKPLQKPLYQAVTDDEGWVESLRPVPL